jgi:hypothetical protein
MPVISLADAMRGLDDGRRRDVRWDLTYREGAQGELFVADLMERLSSGFHSHEVKRKAIADSLLFIEYEHNPGLGRYVPSGLATTEADYWWFVYANTGMAVVVPTERLRRAVSRRLGVVRDGGIHGGNPTRGRLIYVDTIASAAADA